VTEEKENDIASLGTILSNKSDKIAQSLTHITYHIIEQTKTSKSLVEIKELCIFLVVKYSVADIDIPSRLSPSVSVDDTWHWLLLFPSVYSSTCHLAYELAAILTENDFAYTTFPQIVDHNPNAANDSKVVKEQRCRATIVEMTRLGLSSITEIKKGRRRGPTKRRKRGKKKTQPVNAGIPIKKEEDAAREEEDEVNKGAASVHCVDIRLIDHNGEETMSRVRQTTRFGRVMRAYVSRTGAIAHDLRFLLYGEQIDPYQTIADLDLQDGDQVEVFLAQTGC
jgi:small ubiquitin-related modifier